MNVLCRVVTRVARTLHRRFRAGGRVGPGFQAFLFSAPTRIEGATLFAKNLAVGCRASEQTVGFGGLSRSSRLSGWAARGDASPCQQLPSLIATAGDDPGPCHLEQARWSAATEGAVERSRERVLCHPDTRISPQAAWVALPPHPGPLSPRDATSHHSFIKLTR